MLEFVDHRVILDVIVKRNGKKIGLIYKPGYIDEWVYERIAEGYDTMNCIEIILDKLKELNWQDGKI